VCVSCLLFPKFLGFKTKDSHWKIVQPCVAVQNVLCEQVSSRPRRGRRGVLRIFKNEKQLSTSTVTSKGARDGLASCQRLLDSRHHYGYHTLWLYVACLSVLLTIYICVGLDQKWFSYITRQKNVVPGYHGGNQYTNSEGYFCWAIFCSRVSKEYRAKW